MSKLAVLFPGQGSQYVGMGLDFYNGYKSVRDIYNTADDILGYSLSEIIFDGSEQELKITRNTQPAIMTTSVAIWNVIKDELSLSPAYMAGHSLGEYSALTASKTIRLEDSIALVNNRGIFMDEASELNSGTMAAVIGLNREILTEICDTVSKNGNIVQIANINTPNQIVISGEVLAVKNAAKLAKDKGAKRIVPLSVSGAFHSVLMESAKDKLKKFVNNIEIKQSNIPVVMNVTAKPETDLKQIKDNLIKQMVAPVLWVEMIEWMVKDGVDTFIEVGPGLVLSGLVKKINNNVKIYSIENVTSLMEMKKNIKVVN